MERWPVELDDEGRVAAEIVAVLDGVAVDLEGSMDGWRYGGGRDLFRVAEEARSAERP